MVIFRRSEVSANEAVARFILETVQHTQRSWPHAREELRLALSESLSRNPNLLDDPWTVYYFAMARIGGELQAVRNLLPGEQAKQVIATVYAFLASNPDTGEISESFVRTVDERWKDSLAKRHDPIDALGLTLYEALDLDQTVDLGDNSYINPVVLIGLSAVPIQMGVGWWKGFLGKYRISSS